MDYSNVGGCTHDFTNDHLPAMVSSMNSRLRVAALTLVFLVFIAAPTSANSVGFYVNYNCPAGNNFKDLPVNDCKGQCNTLGSGASSVGISSHGTTCSVYNSGDCTGKGQSVSIKDGTAFGCTNSQVGWINSVRCYTGC